tara:strand:- start:1603 stop:1869 length:267 start_codon:yes stop_codon:yes gene_type:complete
MYKKILIIIYFAIIIFFLTFIFVIYFSKDNIDKIKNNRLDYYNSIEKKISNLPFLENDTNNIIQYSYENLEEKKIKKRYFWNLLKSNE